MEYLLAQRSKPVNISQRLERIKAKEARKAEKEKLKSMMPEEPAVPIRVITLDDLLAEKNANGRDNETDQDDTEEPAKSAVKPANPEQEEEEEEEEPIDDYDFGYVAEMFEEDALRWMTSRLNQAQENKVCRVPQD
jgi:hypothetical protein